MPGCRGQLVRSLQSFAACKDLPCTMPLRQAVLLALLLLAGTAARKKKKLHGPIFGCRVPRKFIVVSGCELIQPSKAKEALG